MDLTNAYLLIAAGVGFVLGCVFAGYRVGERGAEVTFQSGEHTSTRIRAGNSADLAQILRMMREFNPEAPK